jgi:hypothetical protein
MYLQNNQNILFWDILDNIKRNKYKMVYAKLQFIKVTPDRGLSWSWSYGSWICKYLWNPGADTRGGGAHPARPRPKIGKNMIFWRKIVIFHTKYLNNFRASLRSAHFF